MACIDVGLDKRPAGCYTYQQDSDQLQGNVHIQFHLTYSLTAYTLLSQNQFAQVEKKSLVQFMPKADAGAAISSNTPGNTMV